MNEEHDPRGCLIALIFVALFWLGVAVGVAWGFSR